MKKNGELSMRKVKEIFRLNLICNMSTREIGRSCSVSHPTVLKYLQKAHEAGLSSYEQIEKIDDESLSKILKIGKSSSLYKNRPLPDWKWIHQELKKKSVTLELLFEEYKSIYPDGYEKSQFNFLYNQWKKKLNLSMRQTHKAGEKIFVDYAGQTVPVIDRITGEIKDAEIFVAVLGASNYTYAEATSDQTLPNWIGSHIRTFEYFGGVSEIIVPDNLKCGVTASCKYEPDINATYHDMAVHYGTAVIPARVKAPKDKAKVEVGVQIVERWILAALRNREFFSLQELNSVITGLLEKLNTRPFKKLEGTRESLFLKIEKNALLPLPENRYEFAEWKKAKVNIDYHIDLFKHYYSVPYRLVHEEVEVRYTIQTVEIFHKGKRVASHLRDDRIGWHSTQNEHMPKDHKEYADWTPTRIINWAKKIGHSCGEVVEGIFSSKVHPVQGYRSSLGIIRLGKKYSNERVESACKRAIAINAKSYKSIESILKNGLDKTSSYENIKQLNIPHENIRGGEYYKN